MLTKFCDIHCNKKVHWKSSNKNVAPKAAPAISSKSRLLLGQQIQLKHQHKLAKKSNYCPDCIERKVRVIHAAQI